MFIWEKVSWQEESSSKNAVKPRAILHTVAGKYTLLETQKAAAIDCLATSDVPYSADITFENKLRGKTNFDD